MPQVIGGDWIWCAAHDGPNAYADFSQPFEYAGKARLTLAISADTQYVAYLNGAPAAFGQYADYPSHKVYDEIDLTALACQGENRLCVQVSHDGTPSSVYKPGRAALRFCVSSGGQVLCASGEGTLSRPSPDYVSGDIEKVTGQLSYSFHYRLDRRDGWLRDPEKGFAPSVLVDQHLPLHPRPIKRLLEAEALPGSIVAQGRFLLRGQDEPIAAVRMQQAYLSPAPFAELTAYQGELPFPLPCPEGVAFSGGGADGVYLIVDLGAEEAGFLQIELDAPDGVRVDIGYGEHLDDLRVRTSVGGRNYGAQLTWGGGRQRFIHRHKRIAGRYLQLFVHGQPFTLHQLSIRPVAYPVREAGSFRCGDHLHQRIHDTAVRTLRLCMHEHYEDCPMREQALYAMDSRNQMLFGYYAFGEYPFARASLALLAQDQWPDGLLPLCAPSEIPFTIPSFSLFWVIALHEYVLFSRDTAFGAQMLPVAARVLDAFLMRRGADGLVSRFEAPAYWNFYEWQPGLDGGEIVRTQAVSPRLEAPLNALLALALEHMTGLCALLGESSAGYQRGLALIRDSFHAAFWRADAGLYSTFVGERHFSAYVNALAICAGLCPAQEQGGVLSRLAHPPAHLIPATLSCDIFRYEALLRQEEYQSLVLDDIAATYGRMLYAGATSFWETQKGAWDFGLAASLCHAWSAVPVYVYYAHVLGVRPAASGGYEVSPAKSGIPWAQGRVALPGGGVDVTISPHSQAPVITAYDPPQA